MATNKALFTGNIDFAYRLLFVLFASISAIIFMPSVNAAGTFALSPASGTFRQSCQFSVAVNIAVSGDQSNAADAIITYDPTKIEIIDALPSIPGIQIKSGNAYEVYVGNTVNTTTGTIKLVGYSTTNYLTTNATFATIYARPKVLATSGSFQFTFSGASPYNTLDSNIADATTSYDILSSVTNASYTFTTGVCTADVTPPAITFISPTNLSNNNPANSQFLIKVADDASGVTLDSVVITINGTSYYQTSPEFTYEGTPADYKITIVPAVPIPANALTVVSVSASDTTGNKKNANMTVNALLSCPPAKVITLPGASGTPTVCAPIQDKESPVITIDSLPLGSLIKGINSITITATDDTGLIPETFKMVLGPTTYTIKSTPTLITQSGNKTKYTFVVKLADLSKVATTTVSGYIAISDLSGNEKLQSIYYKLTDELIVDTTKPVPTNGTKNNSANQISISVNTLLITVALLGTLALVVLSGLLTSAPTVAIITDAQTKRRIPFARVNFSQNGQHKKVTSDLFGRVHARLTSSEQLILVQKYEYEQKSTVIANNENTSQRLHVIELKRL
jgi:hypothetical protein